LFVDLNSQLSDIKLDVSIGGRHPLPSTEQFSKVLYDLGISINSHVVVYDNSYASNAAARFWWMLKAAGIYNVQVLNGGFQVAIKHKFPTSSMVEIPKKAEPILFKHWLLPTVGIDEVEIATESSSQIIIDVRDKERFNGKIEPIDLIAGHIPNAVNIPFTENINQDGLFKKPEELNSKYQDYFKDNIIVHCGSGVTACHTILAMAHARLEIPKLYVGSWSEWSRNNKKMEKE
jgi:thiosulfate/3-mercaptopyruvate sulfurtransferase